ncbi:serine protease inhibitor Kazal-type 2 [Musca domestica]|uniref:Serine protease inhibitor Kazal-type 2 n=1 Tax=Musca domestica TaxID=7370 RepID=A0A1I8MCQ3_MUSDO|nr:serine protease inhibitor Kazal-type 2 [Musca domestica]
MKFLHLILALVLAICAFNTQPASAELCPCPRNYDPVCGSNLVTYSNRCEFECSKREVERSGRSLGLARSGPC